MRTLARWANHQPALAIALLIVCELLNGYNGLGLGAALLEELPLTVLQVGIGLLLGWAMAVRQLARQGQKSFGFGRWCIGGAFLANFLLFVLLGGSMAPRPGAPSGPLNAWGRRIDHQADSLSHPTPLPANWQLAKPARPVKADEQTGKRILFVGLLLLGIGLAVLATGLACSIACSGHGFAAVLVLLLGLGFPAGGIYFASRLGEHPIKKASEFTPAERRRATRRFFKAWGILVGLVAFLLLLAAVV
ncbi:hypothetical protein [Fibrella forsythiae]|uniref:Uncharacterized protein n=1 Tax=Fibrella forsythiae TaxID=2817061 RepID=A0ABS3JSD3_9BACT|nr:hypothetical protein [Fibrella forsythiae]MBO0952916.1 hypothetical protein [Fibrella forsythiae]